MVVDVQLYEGPLARHRHAGRDARAVRRRHRPRLRRATPPATAMLETAERLTEEREPALQQFLLLAGGLQLAGRRRARARAGARRLPAALARRRGLGAELPRLRALRRARARTGPSTVASRRRRSAPRAARPARRRPRRQTLELLAALLAGDWARGRRERRTGTGARAAAWSPRSCSGTSSAGCARCGCRAVRWRRAGYVTPHAVPPFAAPRPGRGPPALPADLVPAARRDRHGRQRPLGQRSAACRAPRATRPARPRCSTSSPAPSRSASRTSRPTRSRPRTGSARPTRCAS